MQGYVRSLLFAASLSLCGTAALASANGVFLPSAPSGPGGEDSIETSSGVRCRQSMNSNGSYLDIGVVGNASSPLPDRPNVFASESRDREAMAYARLTIPLGRKPQRMDCSEVFQLEIQRLRREIELMKLAPE